MINEILPWRDWISVFWPFVLPLFVELATPSVHSDELSPFLVLSKFYKMFCILIGPEQFVKK